MRYLIIIIFLTPFFLFAQSYSSYFLGNPSDVNVSAAGGICLMGGATENDNAMRWFLQQANGGDVLVLRASGSNGYQNYLYSELGIPVNSVETIVCHQPAASFEPYVLQKISQAEAIWFAGGNQWNYVSYWRNTPVDSLLRLAISERRIVVGGTSAGMAILGNYYFSAANGSVSSATALSNPYANQVTVDSTRFLEIPFLWNVITDTHFDNPDRRGRLVAFLARIKNDYNLDPKAIACDEYTAVCLDSNGIAHVFGGFPTYDDNAWFVQTNCELSDQNPEICSPGVQLSWNLDGKALKVLQIKGTQEGSNNFDLNDWVSYNNGQWFEWSVHNGVFQQRTANPPFCQPSDTDNNSKGNDPIIFPNPARDFISINWDKKVPANLRIDILDSQGRISQHLFFPIINKTLVIQVSNLPPGVYNLILLSDRSAFTSRSFIKI
jgi:cyanophycinase-like exopeptidase